MKKILILFIILTLTLNMAILVNASNGEVTYSGNSGQFIFEPGSEHSVTNLFSEFKDVMPGDVLTQKITVKNNAKHYVKAYIYLRALGSDESSKDFLSQLNLKIKKSEDNEVPYMFNAAASETADLTDWVLLGDLYSGAEVNLDVILEVPVELDNKYQNQVGYLEWEFKVDEVPYSGGGGSQVTPSKPNEDVPIESPPTGDNSNVTLWFNLTIISAGISIFFAFYKRKEEEKEKEEENK